MADLYHICESEYSNRLDEQVDDWLKAGYVLHGPLKVFAPTAGNRNWTYIQAVKKKGK